MSHFSEDSVLGIVGAGAFGREVLPIAVNTLAKDLGAPVAARVVFVDSAPTVDVLNGHRVVTEDEFFDLPCDTRYFSVAIADSRARQRLAESFMTRGAVPFTLLSEQSLVLEDSELGDGGIFCPFVSVTSRSRIGRFFHANMYSYVAHDCTIGDYVTLAPRVSINGNVIIEDHVYIGTGAAIRQGTPGKPLRIGRGAFIGMGALVGEDVPAGATVVGAMSRALPNAESEAPTAPQTDSANTSSDKSRARATIERVFASLLEDDGLDVPPLRDDLVLLSSGLDSLGFAVLVTQLNDELGYDPFTLTEEAVYPRTLGEFVAIYERFEDPQ